MTASNFRAKVVKRKLHLADANGSGKNHEENAPESQTQTSGKLECDISITEGVLMIIVWSFSIAYISYCLYLDSDTIINASFDNFLPGLTVTGRLKDFSDTEWEFWRDFWTERVWMFMGGHVLVNVIFRWSSPKIKLAVNFSYTAFALCIIVNWKILIFLVSYATFGYLVTLTGSSTAIWCSSLLTVSAVTLGMFNEWARSISHDGVYPRKLALLMFATSMITLRYVSFGLDWVEAKKASLKGSTESENNKYGKQKNTDKDVQGQSITYNYVYYLHYCFYLPLFFTGPMFNYNQFHTEFWNARKQWTRKSMKTFVIYGLRLAFAFVLCELILHYFYFNALTRSLETLESLSLWTLGGFYYYLGQFFMVKYVVFYGLPRLVAMTDQVDTPRTPSCIGRISTALPMWRNFDRGLYEFMKKYIYIPVGGGQHGLLRKVLGSALCFAFIFIWHGLSLVIFLCVLVNFIDLILEALAHPISKLRGVRSIQNLSQGNQRRLKCLLRAPLKIFTVIAATIFFAENERVAIIFFKRFAIDAFLLCVFFFYCLGLTDHFITSIERRRQQRNEDHTRFPLKY